jgi:arylsulfatase
VRLAGLLLVALLAGCGAPAPRNALLISVDTLRWDHVGLLGYPRRTTPRLDAFFAHRTIFENAVSPAPCTLPALAQLLYGSYVPRPDHFSLAETLRTHGYATAAFVSQHQLRPDWHRGGAGARLAEAAADGFEVFDVQGPRQVDRHGMSARTAREVSARALAWLADAREPFFLWLHYFDPHDPYEPPPRHREFDRGNGSPRSGDRRLDLMRGRQPGEPWFEAGRIFDARDVQHLVNLYDGEIQFADAQLGRVLDALAERGLADSTVVVFVSDHGEWLGEGERWDHCQTLREVEIRVPFLWSVGGKPLAGLGRVAVPVSTVDLAPTLLAVLGVEYPADAFDGVDLHRPPQRRSVFADWRGATAVRRGPWKLVARDAPIALFELEGDGAERHNRLGEGLTEQSELARELEAFRAAHPVAELHRDVLERLRGLGYID